MKRGETFLSEEIKELHWRCFQHYSRLFVRGLSGPISHTLSLCARLPPRRAHKGPACRERMRSPPGWYHQRRPPPPQQVTAVESDPPKFYSLGQETQSHFIGGIEGTPFQKALHLPSWETYRFFLENFSQIHSNKYALTCLCVHQSFKPTLSTQSPAAKKVERKLLSSFYRHFLMLHFQSNSSHKEIKRGGGKKKLISNFSSPVLFVCQASKDEQTDQTSQSGIQCPWPCEINTPAQCYCPWLPPTFQSWMCFPLFSLHVFASVLMLLEVPSSCGFAAPAPSPTAGLRWQSPRVWGAGNFPRAGRTRNYTLGGLNNINVFSYSSGGWKSKINGLAGLLACRFPPSLCIFTSHGVASGRVCVLNSSYKDQVHIGWGATLMISF